MSYVGAIQASGVVVNGTEAGMAALAQVPEDSVRSYQPRSYQPYWVARATLHQRAGHSATAAHDFGMALGLTESPTLRAHIEQLRARPR